MQIWEKRSLKNKNTLGLDVKADFYTEPTSTEEIVAILNDPKFANIDKLITGCGSNILYKSDYHGLVICPKICDIKLVDCENPPRSNDELGNGQNEQLDDKFVFVRCGAGVEWDDFVAYCVDRGWGGVENLSYIPGKVGASPVQNIGAYGVEAKDSIYSVEYIDILSGELKILFNQECRFGYRDSIFKHELKGRIIITHVTFKLKINPVVNMNYADVNEALKGYDKVDIGVVRECVTAIRKSKLPEPSEVGNAGSFFKNPVVESSLAESLKADNTDLKIFQAEPGFSKIPAAWLIEKCGYKGIRKGNVGVHAKQALVLLAYEEATGEELLSLAYEISSAVFSKFGIKIEPEVNIIG